MKCDELKRKYSDITGPYYGYNEVNEAIEELQDENAELKQKLEDAEADAAETLALLEERNKQVGELKHSLELASNECCSISERAVKNERRLKRALWLMTAEWAAAMGLASCNIAIKFQSREKFEVGDDYREKTIKKYRHRQVVFYKYADYCRAKAENPQNPPARNKKPLRRDVIRGKRLDEDCKRAHITEECGKILCYGLMDNAENTLDKCEKCKAYVWNDEDVNGIKEADK